MFSRVFHKADFFCRVKESKQGFPVTIGDSGLVHGGKRETKYCSARSQPMILLPAVPQYLHYPESESGLLRDDLVARIWEALPQLTP